MDNPYTLHLAQLQYFKNALELVAKKCHANAIRAGFWPEKETGVQDFLDRVTEALRDSTLPGEDAARAQAAINKAFSRNDGELLALMHSELSEMLEGIRKRGEDEHCPQFTKEEIELADVFIRALDYAAARKLRLAEAIAVKMSFNASRPRKHGKAF